MRARSLAGLVFLTALFWTSAAAQVPRLTLTETLRLDPDAEDFSVVSAAFTGPRGILAVVLTMDNQIRLYDSSGRSGTAGSATRSGSTTAIIGASRSSALTPGSLARPR
jgi:hypothetical protein